jgi:glycosyl transferase family 25
MPNNQDWPTYLINLPGNKTRYTCSASQLNRAKIIYSLVDSVNGLDLSAAEIEAVYAAPLNYCHYKAPLTPQEIGCYLSHKAAWALLLSSDAVYALIMEDDFRIYNPESFRSLVDSLAPDKIGISWDVIKLFVLKRPRLTVVSRVFSEFSLIRSLKVPTCMTAYLLSRSGAEKLLRSRTKFFRPVDEDIKYYWEYGLNIFSLDPAPVGLGQQHAELGTVGAARRAKKKQGGLVRKVLLQLKYQIRILVELFLRVGAWVLSSRKDHV